MKHWHGRKSFMGTKREDFIISLKGKKSGRSKSLIILWGKCRGFFNLIFVGSLIKKWKRFSGILLSCPSSIRAEEKMFAAKTVFSGKL